ncbi:MAG: BamA/TamA family outer membrane protein, partial [Balneolaceae bacterium]
EGAVSYNFDEFSTLYHNSNFSIFGRGRHFLPNRPIDDSVDQTDVRRLNLALSFNPRKLILLPKFTFSGTIQAELAGLDSFENDFPYNRYLAQMLFYYNFEPGSMFSWRVRSGSITGEAPGFRRFRLGGIGSLRATPYKSLEGNQMLLSNLEVHFGRENRYSGSWVNLNQFHLILFLDSGWAQQDEQLAESDNPFQGFDNFRLSDMTHDAGIGAGSGLFRFELAWPLNADHRSPTFWVRFNPTF